MSEKFKEIITTIGDLKEGDKVLGTDGKWKDIKILPIHLPKTMFEIKFSNGRIKCSGDHQWTIYGNITKVPVTLDTDTIFKSNLIGMNVGKFGGPEILEINEIEPIPSRCITLIDSNDNLFEIITDIDEDINMEAFKFEVKRK